MKHFRADLAFYAGVTILTLLALGILAPALKTFVITRALAAQKQYEASQFLADEQNQSVLRHTYPALFREFSEIVWDRFHTTPFLDALISAFASINTTVFALVAHSWLTLAFAAVAFFSTTFLIALFIVGRYFTQQNLPTLIWPPPHQNQIANSKNHGT